MSVRLQLDRVTKRFGAREVLRNAQLDVAPGSSSPSSAAAAAARARSCAWSPDSTPRPAGS